MSILGWTWHNRWNILLTINFNYKYFHNSVDWSGLYFKCISLHDCQKVQDYIATVFRLLENAFVKLHHPSHDLIINPPCRRVPKNLSSICHEKYLEKCSSMFLEEQTLCPCSTGKSCGGICFLNVYNEIRTKTC